MASKGSKANWPNQVDESLLSLDPDQIFENRSIDQIKDLLHGLQHESDRKREELRSLVGERYRDLMEAAETIICMRQTSNDTVEQIKIVQDATLRVSKMNQSMGNLKKKFYSEYEEEAQYALAAQIKLLMDIPERIWTSVDSQQYLNATKLYLFARHIHTNLSLNEEIMNSYPVIERQWAAISHFYNSICQGCDQVIASGSSTTPESLNAMTALTLLKGSQPKQVFDELLKKRKLNLNTKLKRQDVSAKIHIINSLAAISSFLETVHQCFYLGTLKENLDQISQEKIVVLLHASAESPVMDFLPSIIRDFKPKINCIDHQAEPEFISLDQSYISKECKTWLDEVHEILTNETSIILSHVHKIVGLSNIRKSVHTFMTNETKANPSWSRLYQDLLGHSLNLWDEFYMHLFRDRVETIINTYISGSIYFLQSSLSNLHMENNSTSSVTDYMMSEAGLNDAKGNELLKLKARSFTPNVQDVCKQFNEMLQTTVSDLKEYVDNADEENSRKNGSDSVAPLFSSDFLITSGSGNGSSDENRNETKEPFALDSDNDFILKCLQKCVIANMDNFMQYVSKHPNELSAISTGRLLQALPDLCPALRNCILAPKLMIKPKNDEFMMFDHAKSTSFSASKIDPEWQSLKTKMDQEADHLFDHWVNWIVQSLEEDIKKGLVNTAENTFEILPAWDSIEISEEGEEGTVIKSTIRVPQHLSVNAFKSLMNFSYSASKIGPHSLPVKAQMSLSQRAATVFCQSYKEFCQLNAKMTQNLALQLYFDLLFVANAMISREEEEQNQEKTLNEISKETFTDFEKHIDPFDLSVFTPYMTNHSKRAVLRHQALLSVIIPQDRYSLMASMKSSIPVITNSSTTNNISMQSNNGGHEQQHEHNVIQLSATCKRFALLPITNSATKRGRDSRIRGMATTSTGTGSNTSSSMTLSASNSSMTSSATASNSSTRRRSKSPVAKTANSFFEAMSSSWFGGK